MNKGRKIQAAGAAIDSRLNLKILQVDRELFDNQLCVCFCFWTSDVERWGRATSSTVRVVIPVHIL